MGIVSYQVVANMLTTRFEDQIENQINRSTVAMLVLPKGLGTTGKRLDWGVKMGTAVGAARAEGADVVTHNNDDKVPAVMEYGNYDDAFKINGKAIRAAAAAGNPAELAALFQDELGDSIERLAKGIQLDLYNGAGGNGMVGLLAAAGPLAATGTYAGIDRATYPQWAANVLSASGDGGVTPGALSRTLMRRVRRTVYETSGLKPDIILCSPAQHEAYGATFDAERRYIDQIRLRGQTIKLDGGYAVLEFDGIPVIEDADCDDDKMLFLNTRYIDIRQQPDIGAGNPAEREVNLRGTGEEQYGHQQSNIMARVNALSRDGDYVRFQLITYVALRSRRCNAMAVLNDLALPA